MSTHEPRLTGTKVCTKCERELPVICFAVLKSAKDGLHGECRDCASKVVKERNKKLRHTKNKTGVSRMRTSLLQMKYEPDGISLRKKPDK